MFNARGCRFGVSAFGLVLFLVLAGTPATRAASTRPGPAPEALSLTPQWSFESNQTGAQAGYWSSRAGDVNGDGYGDVIVGALTYDHLQTDEGAAFVFYGSASGLSPVPSWTFYCNQAFARCGEVVSSAGDVNGDGYDDVLVGALAYDSDPGNGITNDGRAFLFLGSASGLAPTPSWIQSGNQPGAAFGLASSAGDVNGDGFDDVLVTAHFYDNPEPDEGRTFLYLGSAAGLSTAPAWTAETNQTGAVLIASGAGDINGDGFDDILLGSRQYDAGQSNEGKAFLYLGSPSGPGATPIWTAEGDQADAQFGFLPRSAGDVNGDGFGDVLILADSYDNPEFNEGAAFLWYGGPSGTILQGTNGTPANADWRVEGNQESALLRWGGSAGDVDADGFDDLVVGVGLYSDDQFGEGRVLIFRGSPSGLASSPAWTADGNSSGARLGWTVDGAGDVNGDGASDVLASAELLTNGQSNEGGAFVFSGFPAIDCADQDGDGYGFPGSPTCPLGSARDCNDSNPAIFPGAAERCNGLDDDCDGLSDDGNPGGGSACETGRPGTCAAGQVACLGGALICEPLSAASTEVCDGADNDCDGLVDEGVRVQASSSSVPSTINVNSQGTSFTVNLTLNDVCDPNQVQPIPGALLERIYISRAGGYVLPDPLSIACPDIGGSFLFERGLSDNPAARNVSNNGATLRFNVASDGDCRTLDGNRQDVVALLAGTPDNAAVLLCVSGKADGADFESCMPVSVKNHGNR